MKCNRAAGAIPYHELAHCSCKFTKKFSKAERIYRFFFEKDLNLSYNTGICYFLPLVHPMVASFEMNFYGLQGNKSGGGAFMMMYIYKLKKQ